MSFNIVLDANCKIPAYRQIIQQVTSLIRGGDLNPGDKLPTERDLAKKISVARGTIKKAYENLARDKFIEVTHGRGSFVSSRQNVLVKGRKEHAVAAIDKLIQELDSLKFSCREMRTLMDLKIMEKEERMENFRVAAVDCNPESLAIFERQLGFIHHFKLGRLLLDDLRYAANPEDILTYYDMLLTTSTHYTELLGLAPGLRDRIVQVAVSPSQETIIELAGLSVSRRLGVICESENFLRIVKAKLKNLDLPSGNIHVLFIRDEKRLPDFLANLDVVLVPPGYQLHQHRETVYAVQEFTQRGGKMITFDYQIERGSLLHVEERIRQILNR